MLKPKALLLTEGYHGMISQVEGLAKALNADFQHRIVKLKWLWNYIPPKLSPVSRLILKNEQYITENEKFDLVISCGRKSVIPSIFIKKKNKKIFTIHIQDPKVRFNNFDLIVAPEHDELKGENVITSKGAIHYITRLEIEKARSYLLDKIQNEKIVSLILGGPNKYYNFSNEELTNIFREIKSSFISQGYKAIIIPSMRTPKRIIDLAINEFLTDGFVVNSVDKQAYLSSLAIANSIVVTCDSTSMISEAATSGKPIFVAHMQPKRNNYRFKRFYKLFGELGVIKNLGEKVENWTYDSFNEAERIATIINSRLKS
ncbi:MAG: mitochondrial fission ELM1 family protein [Pelagibacteraceae bacterium]|mgnify:CR=1 FL=1|nr:mitochondrial fission ELM1 family protein [Pelagibacteraceae bacterium]